MSGPHGTPEPASILITFSDAGGGWFATAVMSVHGIAIEGPSSSFGRHPPDALDALLERRFCALTDADCPATVVTVDHDPPRGPAAQTLSFVQGEV